MEPRRNIRSIRRSSTASGPGRADKFAQCQWSSSHRSTRQWVQQGSKSRQPVAPYSDRGNFDSFAFADDYLAGNSSERRRHRNWHNRNCCQCQHNSTAVESPDSSANCCNIHTDWHFHTRHCSWTAPRQRSDSFRAPFSLRPTAVSNIDTELSRRARRSLFWLVYRKVRR